MEPCIHCGHRITYLQYQGEECDNKTVVPFQSVGFSFRFHETATKGGPHLHVNCHQCGVSKDQVDYLKVKDALEPFCAECAQQIHEVMAYFENDHDDPEEFSVA